MIDSARKVKRIFSEYGNRLFYGIAINARRDGGHRDSSNPVLIGQTYRALKRLCKMSWWVWVRVVFRPTRVDDPPRRQFETRRDDRLPEPQRRKAFCIRLELAPRGAINSAANAAARDQVFVGRVDERVAIELTYDVPVHYGNLCAGNALTE